MQERMLTGALAMCNRQVDLTQFGPLLLMRSSVYIGSDRKYKHYLCPNHGLKVRKVNLPSSPFPLCWFSSLIMLLIFTPFFSNILFRKYVVIELFIMQGWAWKCLFLFHINRSLAPQPYLSHMHHNISCLRTQIRPDSVFVARRLSPWYKGRRKELLPWLKIIKFSFENIAKNGLYCTKQKRNEGTPSLRSLSAHGYHLESSDEIVVCI